LGRYATPGPRRVNALVDVVRRLEFALGPHGKTIEQHGDAIWHALQDGEVSSAEVGDVVQLLDVARELDRLGDVLAVWAVDISAPRPNAEVDAVTADVA